VSRRLEALDGSLAEELGGPGTANGVSMENVLLTLSKLMEWTMEQETME
jgi:hypothetical protein